MVKNLGRGGRMADCEKSCNCSPRGIMVYNGSKMSKMKKKKYIFTYLIRQDDRSWADLVISLRFLQRNVLGKLKSSYSIALFVEGDPPPTQRTELERLVHMESNNMSIILFDLAQFVNRDAKSNNMKLPHPSDCRRYFSAGYCDMCMFFSVDVFNHPLMKGHEYIVRLDTDSFILNTSKRFIKDLDNLDVDYAYIAGTIQKEDKGVSVGFGQHIYQFVENNMGRIEFSGNWYELCQEATRSPYIYYTNFEVIKISWAKRSAYYELAESIKGTGGIYRYRWGDALIRYYGIKLLSARTRSLKGILYKHSGLYDSRKTSRRIIAKLYLYITGQLHSNELEKKITYTTKAFVGVSQ